MKTKWLSGRILSVVFALAGVAICRADESVDWDRVKNDKYLEWIEHLQLPTASEKQSKMLPKTEVTNETAELVMVLRTVLAPTLKLDYGEIRNGVIPLSNLRLGDDVLYLEQDTPSGDIVIQDGRMLSVLVASSKDGVNLSETEELRRHVLSSAQMFLNIPDPITEGRDVTFFVSQLDIGNSKTGEIYFGMDSSDDWQWRHWYSVIRWWSDGVRVMFQIDKSLILHPEIDRLRMARPPKELTQPRKFGRTSE
jgi:hypothetical protein